MNMNRKYIRNDREYIRNLNDLGNIKLRLNF